MKYKVVTAYDGSRYHGWQKQKNSRGIQDIIEKALSMMHKEPVSITASGRTDGLVHAKGQVFHFTPLPQIPPASYIRALNSILPEDIRILSVEEVEDDFHARFSAKKKRYEYLYTLETNNPFVIHYKAPVYGSVDIARMQQAARVFVGKHDFTAFSSAKIEPEKSRIKEVYSVEVLPEGNDIRLVFEANSFLRYQVRMMAQTILEAGLGNITVEEVKEMLESKNKHACKYNAPAQGLYLVSVEY